MMRAGAELRIDVTEAGTARLLRLSGEFDLAGVDLFERCVRGESRPDTNVVILDMRGLRFIDSSGLRAMITADLRLRKEGARVIVVNGEGQVEEVLKLTGLADRLELAHEVPSDLGLGDRA